MNRSRTLIAIGAGILIVCGIAILVMKSRPQLPKTSFIDDQKRRAGPCPGPKETIQVDGKSYSYLPNWYACHPAERGDRVYFRFSSSLPPVVRTIQAIPGDHAELVKDGTHHRWNLKVEDELVRDADHELHFFGNQTPPVLSLYLKGKAAELKEKNYIVFDDHSPSRMDSGTLGVVSSDDFLGKIEP